MRRKHAAEVEPVVQLEDHDEAAAEHEDFHAVHARLAQALDDLGPHAPMVLAVGGNRRRVVAQIEGQDVASHRIRLREVLYFTGKVNVFWPVSGNQCASEIYVTKSFGKRTKVPMPKMTEGHGGGDDRMRDLIFRKTDAPEYMKLPDSRAGAMSCLTGIAIRNSIDQKRPIKIADLVKL